MCVTEKDRESVIKILSNSPDLFCSVCDHRDAKNSAGTEASALGVFVIYGETENRSCQGFPVWDPL